MRIYVASKTKHLPFWQALRAASVPIVASWIDWPGNSSTEQPTSDEWADHWSRCIAEAAAADITLMYAAEDERQMGALIECGAALAAGKRVFVVSRKEKPRWGGAKWLKLEFRRLRAAVYRQEWPKWGAPARARIRRFRQMRFSVMTITSSPQDRA